MDEVCKEPVWMSLCHVYLTNLEAADRYITRIDNMHPRTKKEQELKIYHLNGYGMLLEQNQRILKSLDKIWSL